MLKRASVALIPLLLLPNFLFLIPFAPIAAGQTSTPPGQPLAPGTVNYRNTWNTSLTQTCPPVKSPTEPLTAKTNGWSAILSVPSLLFMGSPQGNYIKQSFALSNNGTFSASDDHGNFFSFTVPISLSGTHTDTSLIGNSTTAIRETSVTAGSVAMADVKLIFSVYKLFCQPAGVRLEVAGTENWGPSGQGAVKIIFDRRSISTSGFRAIFSNKSGVALGFDWSDSKALNPSYDKASTTLSYQVGNSFSIDPVTVGTSTDDAATRFSYQTHICVANGRTWVFYYSGGFYGFVSSADWFTWSSLQPIYTSGARIAGGMGIACSGTTFYVAVISSSSSSKGWYFNSGTLNSNGSISFSLSNEIHLSTSTAYYVNTYAAGPSVTVDTTGKVWVGIVETSNTVYTLQLWRCSSSCGTASNWSDNHDINYTGCGQVIPLTSGKLAVVFSSYCSGNYGVQTYDGSSFWNYTIWTSLRFNEVESQMTSLGDTVEACAIYYTSSQTLYYTSFTYGASAWSTPIALVTGTNPGVYSCATSIATPSTVIITYDYNPLDPTAYIGYVKSDSAGAGWGAPSKITSGGQVAWMSAPSTIGASNSRPMMMATYSSSGGTPNNVYFISWPLTTPTAATGPNSWSRPGLSPYESYFAHFSDYVSPGNGLLAAELGTLSLPGRGLDLNPEFVFSTPYAFRSSGSPYLYDNYTGANLGYGWSLNFPWLGTNYLHLTDGQAYPYSWSGNKFVYHGSVDFNLTSNTGGTYILTLKDGTRYQFNSAKQLTSETDHSGNNTILFSYGTNNYISKITDTIRRNVTLSYNGNNQLTTITSGTRSWSLGYSGSNLASLTDPLSRVTSFQMVGTSGANAWLLSSITYPTTGKTTYSYGSAPVGTEVTTYYVTSRNIYSSSTQLTRSDSISYSILNGVVTWSHMKASDGSNVQGYQNFNFQTTPKNLMKLYDANPSNQTVRQTENDYDSSGRINATKLISPTNQVLATTTKSYDNWGNLIYLKDNIGQQTWFSYANTNSANSFGSSGCTTSFYSQTVSSKIDDALVGRCDYQNGSGTPQQQTYYKYDKSGNLLEQKVLHNTGWLTTDHTYDRYGNALTTTDALSRVTYYRYSSTYSSAYLTKQSILVGTQNVTTTYTYDSAKGFLLSTTNPNGQTTSYQYDSLGRVTTTTYPAVGGVSATRSYFYYDNNDTMKTVDENGHVTKQYFDGLARQTKVERWNGSSVYSYETYTYNWLDAVATKTTAAGNTYTYTYDQDGRVTKLTNPDTTYSTTSYDDVNNRKTVADENGHQTVYAYDWNQRLTSVKQYNSSTNYFLTTYSYDLSGNQLATTDAKGRAASYAYDDLNRLTTATFPDTKTETRTYDNVGNLATRTTPNGSQIQYTTYDQLNRLTKVTYPGSGGTVTYTYDPDSNRLSMVNPSATNYYSYDARDRLTNSTKYIGGVKYQTLYQYDKSSDVTQITYPDGVVFSATYDGANRLKTAWGFATLAYTVDDKISKITYGNGEVATYAYDNRDRPTQIQDKYGSTKEMSLNYTYDGTGNVLTLNTETYHYDWLNRLNYSSGPWGTYKYTYDQVGNRIKMVQGTTTTLYTYGKYYRIKSAGTVTYTNDTNGNMATKNDGTTWTFSYDYENRLTKVVHSGTTVQTNSYDADGNRVKQVAGSSTFTYSYQGLNILYDKNVTGGTTTITKHFYAGGLQVGKMVGSTRYYFHQDALGSTRLVATSTVTIKFSSNYIPYGQNYAVSGKEVFMYIGKPYDTATGLYYFGARYFDSTTGRFITQDTYAGSKNDPMSMNRYIYARDNPERYVDLNGHMFMATAVTVEGRSPRAWQVYAAPKTTPTNYADVNRVSYTLTSPSPGSTPFGTPVRSADLTLTQQGTNQYAPQSPNLNANMPPPTYANIPTIATPPQNGLLGAVIVTLGVADLTIFLCVAAAVAWGSAEESGGFSVPGALVLTSLAISGAGATGSMIYYDATSPSPNPEDALQAGGVGFLKAALTTIVGWGLSYL